MQALLTLSKLMDGLSTRIGKLTMWLILATTLISAGNAIVRKVFGTSSNAWLEVQWYMFAFVVMLGAPHVLRLNEHVRVDVIYGKLAPRKKAWVDLLGTIFFLLPGAILIGEMAWPWLVESYVTGEMSSNAGGLVIWPAKGLLLAGFGLLALQGLSEIIKKIGVMRGLIPDPAPFVTAHAAAEKEGEALVREIGK